jgi:hypothetical protein
LSARLFEKETNAVSFAVSLRHFYAMEAFSFFVKNASAEAHEHEIARRVASRTRRRQRPVEAIIEGTLEYINESKLTPIACVANWQRHYAFCQYFSDVVDAMTLSIVLEQISRCPLPAGRLPHSLPELSDGVPFLAPRLHEAAEDPDVQVVIGDATGTKFLLSRAEMAFQNSDLKWGTGEHILLFLEIEKRLAPIFDHGRAIEAMHLDKTWYRKVMTVLFGGKEPDCLRTALIKVAMAVTQLRQTPNPLLGNVAEIGNPVDDKMVASIRNLLNWFGFKPGIFPLR